MDRAALKEDLKALSALFSYPTRPHSLGDLKRAGLMEVGNGRPPVGTTGLRTLQNAYVRLFINALPEIPCPPYGSFHLEGTLMGVSTLRIRDLYAAYGFQTREMPDHIAVELEFLHLLTHLLPVGDLEVRQDHAFLLEHLRLWSPAFFEGVEVSDESGFYAGVCRFAGSVLQADFMDEAELLSMHYPPETGTGSLIMHRAPLSGTGSR